MAKIPDFSELTKKFDIQGLVDTVKSAVSGGGAPPKAPEGDEVAAKFVEALNLMQGLVATHAEQGKAIANIHSKLNALYKDTQLLKETTTTEITTKKEKNTKVKAADEGAPKQEAPAEKSE